MWLQAVSLFDTPSSEKHTRKSLFASSQNNGTNTFIFVEFLQRIIELFE